MNTDQQVYMAGLDGPSPPSDIQRYKDAVLERADRVDMELYIREQEPHLSTREVRRKVERHMRKRNRP